MEIIELCTLKYHPTNQKQVITHEKIAQLLRAQTIAIGVIFRNFRVLIHFVGWFLFGCFRQKSGFGNCGLSDVISYVSIPFLLPNVAYICLIQFFFFKRFLFSYYFDQCEIFLYLLLYFFFTYSLFCVVIIYIRTRYDKQREERKGIKNGTNHTKITVPTITEI